MPDETTTGSPEIEVVGPPILTVYFRNKRDDEDKPVAGQQEVADFSINGSFLVAQTLEGELMVFPEHELEYATLTPQLSIKEGTDGVSSTATTAGGSEADVAADGSSDAAREAEGAEGGKLIVPNFGGGSGDSSEAGEEPS
jgi:hypothetical protein